MKTGGGDGESEIWGTADEGGRGAWRRRERDMGDGG